MRAGAGSGFPRAGICREWGRSRHWRPDCAPLLFLPRKAIKPFTLLTHAGTPGFTFLTTSSLLCTRSLQGHLPPTAVLQRKTGAGRVIWGKKSGVSRVCFAIKTPPICCWKHSGAGRLPRDRAQTRALHAQTPLYSSQGLLQPPSPAPYSHQTPLQGCICSPHPQRTLRVPSGASSRKNNRYMG